MAMEKITCRECGMCDVESETCTLTSRKVTLDSLRACKRSIKKSVRDRAWNNEQRKN